MCSTPLNHFLVPIWSLTIHNFKWVKMIQIWPDKKWKVSSYHLLALHVLCTLSRVKSQCSPNYVFRSFSPCKVRSLTSSVWCAPGIEPKSGQRVLVAMALATGVPGFKLHNKSNVRLHYYTTLLLPVIWLHYYTTLLLSVLWLHYYTTLLLSVLWLHYYTTLLQSVLWLH